MDLQKITDKLAFTYHDIYERFGEEQTKDNFHCFDPSRHEGGVDNHPSMSVSNETGQYFCHGCGLKGNLITYYQQLVKGTTKDEWGGKVLKFLSDLSGIALEDENDTLFVRNYARALNDLEKSKKYFNAEAIDIDRYVDALLENTSWKKFLYDNRRITESIIKQYRVGLKDNKILFPSIDKNGKVVNAKLYSPGAKVQKEKWSYLIKGVGIRPGPIDNMLQNKFYIMEGEPDAYCAIAMGLSAITFGAASNINISDALGGEKEVEYFFKNKEVVFALDSDKAGTTNVVKVADKILKYVKQVKILNLDATELFPDGLDPELRKTNGKRIETDFTDLMVKHDFNIDVFKRLEELTPVYTKKQKRTDKSIKVSLTESTKDVYYDIDSKTSLETIAFMDDINESIFKMPVRVRVTCRHIQLCNNDAKGPCRTCIVYEHENYTKDGEDFVTYNMIPFHSDHRDKKDDIRVSEYDLLRLINVNESDRKKVKKEIVGIPARCPGCKIDEVLLRDVHEVNLREVGEVDTSSLVQAYIVGSKDKFEHNKTYTIKAIQTKWHANQSSVLYVYETEAMDSEYENFEMTPETRETLNIFTPKVDETISDALKRRYDIFSAREGLVGRNDLFFLADLAFFSPIELNHDLIKSVTRGWIEVMIVGTSRCGKTIAVKAAYKRYGAGEMILSSEGLSRSGLLAGMNNTRVRGGAAPRNDGGMLIIDEMSDIDPKIIKEMKSVRDNGIVELRNAFTYARMNAKNRKIFCSNWRESQGVSDVDNGDIIKNLVDLCTSDSSLTRFDIVAVVRASDVESIDTIYSDSPDFTDYQCRELIKYTWSRKWDDYKFEEGFNEAIEDAKSRLKAIFEPETFLVNKEMSAKLIKLSIALASMLFSTNGDKVFIKVEHAEYMEEFLTRLYCGKNMKLDEFSEKIRAEKKLKDTVFIDALLQEVDVETLMRKLPGGISTYDLQDLFADYIIDVSRGIKTIARAMIKNGREILSTGHNTMQGMNKLRGILVARNCIKTRKGQNLVSTEGFNAYMKEWLENENSGKRPHNDLLESSGDGYLSHDALFKKNVGKSPRKK